MKGNKKIEKDKIIKTGDKLMVKEEAGLVKKIIKENINSNVIFIKIHTFKSYIFPIL